MHILSEREDHDGSKWKRYKTASGLEIVVTGALKKIMSTAQPTGKGTIPRFLSILRAYRLSHDKHRYDENRQVIAEGQEAIFYGTGDSNLGVREDKTDTGRDEGKLEKMDTIRRLLELGSLPHWIKTPAHYALIKKPQLQRGRYRKLMLVQKIDGGVTAFDIVNGPRNEQVHKAILSSFPNYKFTSLEDENFKKFRKEIMAKYMEVIERLKTAFLERNSKFKGWNFDSLFNDLLLRNFVVSSNENLIGESGVTFWIIDQ